MILEPFQVALSVADVLERCGVPYVVGGSLASSVSGEPRSTLDIDLVVAMTEADVEPFLATLGGSFQRTTMLCDGPSVSGRASNLFHRATSTKVDLFIAGGSPLDRQAMRRRVRLQVASGPDRFLYVYTPEDILLQKLRWYRLGGEVSDRQWRDILGIVLVQEHRLDEHYLRDGAHLLDVTDLLDRALQARS